MARWRHGTGRKGGRIAAAIALAGACLLAPTMHPGRQSAAAAPRVEASAPAPAWTPVKGATPRFALEAPELEKLPAASGLFRTIAGATEDRLSRGSLRAAEAPFVEVVLRHRAGQPQTTLFVALARLAASEGYALLHLATPTGFSSKFGGFAGARAWLADDDTERPCLVFRHEDRGADFTIAGWYCSAGGSDPEPQVLACLLDRLTLAEAVDDPGLERIFAAAAKQPATCQPSPQETVTGGIAAPPTPAHKAKSHPVKKHKARPHKPRTRKARPRRH
jgi:hypothetical protein